MTRKREEKPSRTAYLIVSMSTAFAFCVAIEGQYWSALVVVALVCGFAIADDTKRFWRNLWIDEIEKSNRLQMALLGKAAAGQQVEAELFGGGGRNDAK